MVKVRLEFPEGAPIDYDLQALPRMGELVALVRAGGDHLLTYEVKYLVHLKGIVRLVLIHASYDASAPLSRD